jgi:hypothetical protein
VSTSTADLAIKMINRQLLDNERARRTGDPSGLDVLMVGPNTLKALIGEIYRLRAALAPAHAIGDDELPVHCPITVTADGQGPAAPHEAVATTCWCADAECTKFYGVARVGK